MGYLKDMKRIFGTLRAILLFPLAFPIWFLAMLVKKYAEPKETGEDEK
jgi:hypothetical protein